MVNKAIYDILVIGAGAGGLVVAIGAARAGKKVLLIEKGKFGGDCTNYGCIPSKALIASAHVAYTLQTANAFGIETSPFSLNNAGALKRVQSIVKKIRSAEEPPILKGLGVETLEGTATFIDKRTLEVNGKKVCGKEIAVYTVSLKEIDRSITEGTTEGFVKIITKKWSSKILGATIVAPHAGEMLMEISTAMHAGLPLRKLASLIHPYPIECLAVRKAADKYLTETLLGAFRK